MDAEAEKRFTDIEKKIDRLLVDAKTKTGWQGQLVKKVDILLSRKG